VAGNSSANADGPIGTSDVAATLQALKNDAGISDQILALVRLQLGVALVLRGRPEMGVDLVKEADREGVAAAGDYVGVWYQNGKYGLPRDKAEGLRWLERSVDKGNPFAAWSLLLTMMAAPDATTDFTKAGKLFTLAYVSQLGQAVDFVNRARKGDAHAREVLTMLKLDPDKMPRTVGEIYQAGLVGGHMDEARRQLEGLVANKVGGAYSALATMLLRGEGGPKDPRRAIDLYLEQAGQGAPASFVYAAVALASDKTTPNYAAASVCLILAKMRDVVINDPAYDVKELSKETDQNLSGPMRSAVAALENLASRIAASPADRTVSSKP
jgi:TPR repeat protein